MTTRTDLTTLLALVVGALVDPPERSYVSHGAPSHDCEQLTVRASQRNASGSNNPLGSGAGSANRKAVASMTSYVVTLVRCQPTVDDQGYDPDADALTTAALDFQDEVDQIYSALIDAVMSGTLFTRQVVTWRSVTPQDPQGGLAEWSITMEVAPT